MWSPTLITLIVSFFLNLIISTFYFSSIISTKASLHKHGFIISFLGTSAGAIFSLSIPLLPAGSIPWSDISHGLVFVIWLSSTKYYTQMSWLESFAATFFGTLFYAVVSVLVSALVSGYWEIFAEGL